MADPMTVDRWFLSDCEGRLEIWREAVLRNVTRDENGEINSYRLPAAYKDTDLIASWDLTTWDEGEDPEDDARRRIYAEIVRVHNEGEKAARQEQRVREVVAGAYAREKRLLEWADDVKDEQREAGIRAVALEARSIAQQVENALAERKAGHG